MAGIKTDISIAMIAMTTNNSMSVNAVLRMILPFQCNAQKGLWTIQFIPNSQDQLLRKSLGCLFNYHNFFRYGFQHFFKVIAVLFCTFQEVKR